jgi:TonB family protein
MKSAATTKSAGKKLAAKRLAPAAPAKSTAADSAEGELVVYEKGKVIFRLKSPPTKPDQAQRHQAEPDSTQQANDSIVKASSTTKIAPSEIATTKIATSKSVWLSPEKAETRLLSRTEPQYPAEGLAAHRAGNVVLKVQVAEDGSVSSTRTLRGDPLLAAAAAEAVRNWRYQPYRLHGHPAQFQTDVTLTFALPN